MVRPGVKVGCKCHVEDGSDEVLTWTIRTHAQWFKGQLLEASPRAVVREVELEDPQHTRSVPFSNRVQLIPRVHTQLSYLEYPVPPSWLGALTL